MAQLVFPPSRPPLRGEPWSIYIVVVAVLFVICVFLFYFYTAQP